MSWGGLAWKVSLSLSFCLYCLAQSPTANIVGTVKDQSGAFVPGASITVRQTTTNEERQVKTDENGEYTVAELSPGGYAVVVEREGFHRVDERGITLEIDQTAQLDFVLQLGAVSDAVEVTASVPLLNTESAMKGDVIVSREMTDIPLDGRDFADLAYLVPGVAQKAQGASGSNFAVNGARTDNTNFIIDGFNDQSPRGGSAQARPPIDAMMEFKMQTTGYSAEYGRLAGGTMNMALKSGTNRAARHAVRVRPQRRIRRARIFRSGEDRSCGGISSAPCSTVRFTFQRSTTAATAPSSCSIGRRTGR